MIARLIGHPTIVGYMLAGIAIGPFTPGFVGDVHTASQLAELGVIFLMFGVGVHFSLSAHGVPTLFGDAANSEVLSHAVLDQARMLVVTVPDEAAAELIVGAARVQAPTLPTIVRAATESGIKRLARLGARQVVHPELEGGLQIVRRTLLELGFPLSKVQEYEDVVRTDSYDLNINTSQERQLLQDLLRAGDNIGIAWLRLAASNPLVGHARAQADLRAMSGASIVAIMRAGALITNPDPQTVLRANDLLGVIGDAAQLEAAKRTLSISGVDNQ